MDRDTAITRINDGVGFRATGHSLTDKFILRMQEAQRDLEKGKTLPRFLLQEDASLALVEDAHTVALPTGFLRDDDDNPIHYIPSEGNAPVFLQRKRTYKDAVNANIRESSDSVEIIEEAAPTVYVIRNSTIDFITTADTDYTLYWNYYKSASLLTSNIENAWLANASEWLIGEAGMRIARDVRDGDALAVFTAMRDAGRAAVFGDILALEDSGGPITMGEDN